MNYRIIPIKVGSGETASKRSATPAATLQRRRRYWQAGFFILFCFAPIFNLLRYDITERHAWLLGMEWHIGLDAFFAGQISGQQAALNVLFRLILPIVGIAISFLYVAWRWGRLYCGWLCPHFSVVETINQAMRRASGKHSVWEQKPLPARDPDGTPRPTDKRWWFVTVALAVGFAFCWAVVLLTYLLPPAEVYGNLLALSPTRNQFIFISVATTVISMDFLFARHLFCRYGCAVGMFQSLAWMGNRGAMVVGFARNRAADCATCYADHVKDGGPGYSACEGVCPMRLKPRGTKNAMFTCTQCGQCINACTTVQREHPEGSLLNWVEHEAAQQNEAAVSLTGRRD